MKKTASLVLILVLALSILAGCGGPAVTAPQASPSKAPGLGSLGTSAAPATTVPASPAASAKPSADAGSNSSGASASLKPATNPSEGFSNYSTVKNNAYERITTAAEKNDSLSGLISMSYLGVTMVDLTLIPLTMLVGDTKTSEMAMAMLLKDAKITGGNNNYTITYTNSDGSKVTQTCKYDPAKDQMTSTMTDSNGKIGIFFEYVNLGNNTYVAQYYSPSDDGKYQVIRAYFDKTNVAAFGILTATSEPASIIGKSGLNADFVKNDESYTILKDGKLSVFDKGTTTTN